MTKPGEHPFLGVGEAQIEQQDDVDAEHEHELGREGMPIDRWRDPVGRLGE
jgi:hypothetical protein